MQFIRKQSRVDAYSCHLNSKDQNKLKQISIIVRINFKNKCLTEF